MSAPPQPPRGHMVLYDRMDPPLPAGEYLLAVSTDVSLSGATLPADQRFFNVEGPRFALAPTEVSSVFPPRNARGAFMDALPHVALGRRTLPWERTADPRGALPLPPAAAGDPPRPTGAPPWLALLLVDETGAPEATVLPDVPVAEVLPAEVRAVLAPPADARCAALELRRSVLRGLLPTVEELHLLTHVRQVNLLDRELSAGDSDGWFSVVVSSRVPQSGHKYRACLVSVEGRTDLLTVTEPPVAPDFIIGPVFVDDSLFVSAVAAAGASGTAASGAAGTVAGTTFSTSAAAGAAPAASSATAAAGLRGAAVIDFTPGMVLDPEVFDPHVRLVLLHAWTFECEGRGTFQQLAERVDVGLMGEVRGELPRVADTGHLPLELRDRAGALETVWYRGPLVSMPITRDGRGPYHTADQARRVSPETGMEDVSYAAAFEVGRLLAAADGRLAQELMRWRRGDYRRSVEGSLADWVKTRLPALTDRLALEAVARVLVERWIDPQVKVVDPFELSTVVGAPGLDPARLSDAWAMPVDRITAVLTPQIAALAPPLEAAPPVGAGTVTLDDVVRDTVGLGLLAGLRDRTLALAGREGGLPGAGVPAGIPGGSR